MPIEQPAYLSFDVATRRLKLSPNEPAFVQDPYAAYRWLHEHGGTFFWEDYGLWCCGRYEDVNRLFRDRRLGRERPGGYFSGRGDRSRLTAFDALEVHSLLEREPPVHTRLRGLVNRAFVSRQVERLRPRVEALCHELIDSFPPGRPFDLLAAFAAPLPIVIISEMLGVPVAMGPRMLDWSHRMVAMYMHRATPEVEAAAEQASREFADFLRSHIAERRKSPGDDLLSLLISAQQDGQRLTEDELVSSAVLLLNAGHEATVHQTGNAVRAILSEGGDPRRFFATLEDAAATVEECLRYDAPLHMFTRYVYEPVEIAADVTVKPGESVALLLGMANRDPDAFGLPDDFSPGRPDQKNVSFGAGIHFCIGAPLARLELQVALNILFDRLPDLSLAELPVYGDTYHFHGLATLMCETG